MAVDLGRRIDDISVASSTDLLDIAACHRILGQPVRGTWVSDHFGVTAYPKDSGPRSDALGMPSIDLDQTRRTRHRRHPPHISSNRRRMRPCPASWPAVAASICPR